MEELKNEFKLKLIEALNLEDITPDDIENDAPLFGEGLGLDSIDALEIMLILEKSYGIRFENGSVTKEIFFSIDTLTNYISQNRK